MHLLHACDLQADASNRSPFGRCVDSSLLLDGLSSPCCGHGSAGHCAPLLGCCRAAHRGHHGLHGMHDCDRLRASPQVAAAVGREAVGPLVWGPALGHRHCLVYHALAWVHVRQGRVDGKAADPARPARAQHPRSHHAAAVAIGIPWVPHRPLPSPAYAKGPEGCVPPGPCVSHDCILYRFYALVCAEVRMFVHSPILRRCPRRRACGPCHTSLSDRALRLPRTGTT